MVKEFFQVLGNAVGFLALMVLLIWFMSPHIPGVHGFWQEILDFAGALGFYFVAGLIYRTGKKKALKL